MARATTKRTVARAKALRRSLSLPEVLLWARLKGADPHIRKQHPVGPYILDFYCASRKLAIEVDGFAHDMGNRPQRDEARTAWLNERGIEVVRIPARDVLADPDSIADALIQLCATPLHHPRLREDPPPHRFAAGRSE